MLTKFASPPVPPPYGGGAGVGEDRFNEIVLRFLFFDTTKYKAARLNS